MSAALPVVERYLTHLRVERRLAERTLAMYGEALQRLRQFADTLPVDVLGVQPHHVRRWAGQMNAAGLAPRSIALALSAWRGFYRWLGRDGAVALNPVDGVRAPKAARPLPKALAVDQAVALADHIAPPAAAGPAGAEARALEARDRCIVEMLYGSGLRIAELVGLDAVAGPAARGWVDRPDAAVHVLGKGGRRRSVPVGRQALAALDAWLPLRAALAANGQPALFVGRNGTRLTPVQARSRLRDRAVQAGVTSPAYSPLISKPM